MASKSFVRAGGHRLGYRFINDDLKSPGVPRLLFLHEGLGCIDKWKEFPDKLSERLSLPGLVYERYGYGDSDTLEEPRQPNFLHREALDILPEVLQELEITEKLILIGHSDGGSISLLYASKFPDNVLGLILEAPHVMVEKLSAQGLKAAIMAYEHSDLKERLYKYHGKNTDSMFWGWANIWSSDKSLSWNIEEYLGHINAPVLFIQGENDQYGTLEQLEAIRKGVSGPVISEIIPECGHIPHHEAEDAVLATMHTFISGLNQNL